MVAGCSTHAYYLMKLDRRYFLRCLHLDNISFLEFSRLGWSDVKIKVFSIRHRLHDLMLGWQAGHLFRSDQVTEKSTLFSFNSQICFDSVVFSFCPGFLKELIWLLYLSLKVVAASPIYVDVVKVSVSLTSALQTTDEVRHSPATGQRSAPTRQLQFFCNASGGLERTFLLCPDIIVSMFGIQLQLIFTFFLLKYF